MMNQLRRLQLLWPRSLRVRVALPFMALSVSILVFLFFFLGSVAENTQLANLRDDLRSQADIAAFTVSELGDQARSDPQAMVDHLAELSNTRVTLIDADGVVLADSDANAAELENHNLRPEVVQARADGYGTDRRTSDSTGFNALYVAVPVPGSDGLLMRLSVHTTEIQAAVSSTQNAIALAVIVSILATIAASWYFAGRLSRPLEDLMRQAMRISVGDFSVQVPTYGVREVNNVGRAFNRMADRLADVSERQEQTSLRLESVMEGLIDGVVLTDEDGLVLRLNPAAEDMLGLTEEEAFGKPFVQATRDYEMARVLNSAFDGKDKPSAVVDHGVEHQVIQVLARVVDGSQQRLGLVMLRDVTEVRRLETVRREFVANVSHELRTPLTSIRALVETLSLIHI